MMSRKTYVGVANLLSDFKPRLADFDFKDLVHEFSLFFEEDNPAFDADRFSIACNKEG
jgi:hypothetical protein